MFEDFSTVVVGAGFYGATIAERIATVLQQPVALVEKRTHVGGAAYSEIEQSTGIEIHKYGTHIFHTNSLEVWNYVRLFSEFTDYRHRVWTIHKRKAYTIPINLLTISEY